jgi:FeS assembly SUF system protein
MPEDYKHPNSLKSLNVINPNDKVEQLRREFAADGAKPEVDKKLCDQTVVDRALDPRTSPRQKAIVEKVIEVLQTVYDPEIPVNIYELGLIYDICVDEKDAVHVKMTLTAPGCPVAGTLPPEVERKIETIPEVKSARVELVWEPAWTKERMSEAALLELGLL